MPVTGAGNTDKPDTDFLSRGARSLMSMPASLNGHNSVRGDGMSMHLPSTQSVPSHT